MVNATSHVQSALQAANSGSSLDQFFGHETAQHFAAGHAFWRKEFPDITWKLDNLVEKGTRVAFRYTATGTHHKTGKKSSWSGTAVGHMVDGKLHVIRVIEDALGAIVGQGTIPAGPEDNISGQWNGNLWGVPFIMQLQQSPPSDAVTGTISGVGSSLPVTGKNDPPNVVVSGNSPKGTITFTGTWASDSQINGVLNGGGFTNQPVVVNRQG